MFAARGVGACSVRTDEEAEESQRHRFRQWLDVASKPVVIVSEGVEHERGWTVIGSVVVDNMGRTSDVAD